MPNDELAKLHRQHDDDATKELIKRFKMASCVEAKSFYERYKDVSRAEYADLYSVCMCAFVAALKAYKENGGFYTLWKKLAEHNMIDEIAKFSIGLSSDKVFREVIIGEDNEIDLLIACDEDVSYDVQNETLFEKVMEILDNPKNRIKEEDKNMFIYYIHNFSFTEISKMYGISYAVVRLRIKKVISTIQIILNNSKN